MALRKPLVIVDGQIEQLQSGDTLNAAVAEIETLTQTNGESRALVICTPVYSSAVDTVKKGQADASGTVEILGLAVTPSVAGSGTGSVQTSGVLTATTTQWDAVAATADSQSGGLTFNTVYYLDSVAAGKISKRLRPLVVSTSSLGKAISTTEMVIDIKAPILL